MGETRPLAAVIVGNALATFFRVLVGLLGAFATSILVARYLGPDEFGTYRLVLSLVWLLEVVSVLAFPNATTKFVSERAVAEGPRAYASVVRFFLGRATLVYLLGLAILLSIRRPVAAFYRDDALASILVLAALAVLPGLWYGIVAAGLRGLQRFSDLGTVAVVQSLATLAGTALVLVLGGGVRALFVLAFAMNGLGLVLAAGYARRQMGGAPGRPEHDLDLPRRMWRYSLVLGVISIVGGLLSERLEVFFLGRFRNPAEVGFYSLAVMVAFYTRRLGPNALGEVLFPVIARLEGQRDAWGVANAYLHATRYLAMVGCPVGLGGALYAGPLLRVVFGADYAPAAPALAVLFLGGAMASLGQAASSVILSKECYRFLLVSSLVLAVVNVALDLLVIPSYGATGAAAANAVIQAGGLAVQTAFVSRLLQARLPAGNLALTGLATALAWGPALVLRAWPMLGGDAELALAALLFLLLYPLLLASLGVLLPEDLRRLGMLATAMPARLRPATGALVRAITRCVVRGRRLSRG